MTRDRSRVTACLASSPCMLSSRPGWKNLVNALRVSAEGHTTPCLYILWGHSCAQAFHTETAGHKHLEDNANMRCLVEDEGDFHKAQEETGLITHPLSLSPFIGAGLLTVDQGKWREIHQLTYSSLYFEDNSKTHSSTKKSGLNGLSSFRGDIFVGRGYSQVLPNSSSRLA